MADDPRLQTLVSTDRDSDLGLDPALHDRPSGAISLGTLAVDELIAGRFRVRWLSGTGAMGDIYRAHDLTLDRDVALKVSRGNPALDERFFCEAECLASIQHPGIPSYASHGRTQAGVPFVAMEWLDGVCLADYLERERLGLRSAVEVVRQAAEALAAAHEVGVVHRDVNPRNIFLIGGTPDEVRVLDFGVAQTGRPLEQATTAGTPIGTPGYMAPEQVEAAGRVTAAADVFALGCLLFEAITGERAFYAPTLAEVLARILRDAPPLLSEFSPLVPEELDELLERMLNKDPGRRPSNAAHVLREIERLPPLADTAVSCAVPRAPELRPELEPAGVVVLAAEDTQLEVVEEIAESLGLAVTDGDEDTVVVSTTASAGTTRRGAKEQAELIAVCALRLRDVLQPLRMAVAMGLMELGPRVDGKPVPPKGRAYDRALVSLVLQDDRDVQANEILLDPGTAVLLDGKFDVRQTAHGPILAGEIFDPEFRGRRILGELTPFCGRTREMGVLEASLKACAEEHDPAAVLVVGAPGVGKTRLAEEFAHAAREYATVIRGAHDPDFESEPLAIMRDACRRAFQLRRADDLAERRRRIEERLVQLVDRDSLLPEDGLISPESRLPDSQWSPLADPTPERGAALAERLAHALEPELVPGEGPGSRRGQSAADLFTTWLELEANRAPVLLVLDDVDRADLETIEFIERLISTKKPLPLLVVLLARSEFRRERPRCFQQPGVFELRMAGLSPGASTLLVKKVLGRSGRSSGIVSETQGNPFWIEELLKAELDGQGEDVPQGVLLLAQSDICALDSETRFVLRAVSVLGSHCWSSAVSYLTGSRGLNRSVDVIMSELVDAGMLRPRKESCFAGQTEFVFSSPALRAAAYSLLSEEEKEAAHCRAAEWLEALGDDQALPVASHYTLGGEYERARFHYLRAARHALASSDLDGAFACVEEGLAAGARGPDAVELRLIQAEVCRLRGNCATALRAAQSAYGQSDEGTDNWYRAARELAVASVGAGRLAASLSVFEAISGSSRKEDSAHARVETLCVVSQVLAHAGLRDEAHLLVEQAAREDRQAPGHLNLARALLEDGPGCLQHRVELAETALALFQRSRDPFAAIATRIVLGTFQAELGDNPGAHDVLLSALGQAADLGLSGPSAEAQLHFGRVVCRMGAPETGLAHIEEAAGRFETHKHRRLAGLSRIFLAEAHLQLASPWNAFENASHASLLLAPFEQLEAVAKAVELLALIQTGDLAVEDRMAHLTTLLARRPQNGASCAWLALGLVEGWSARGETGRAWQLARKEAQHQRLLGEGLELQWAQSFEQGCPVRARLFEVEASGPGTPWPRNWTYFREPG